LSRHAGEDLKVTGDRALQGAELMAEGQHLKL